MDERPITRAFVDVLSPAEIAQQVETAGVARARAGTIPTLALAVMAGAYIAIGSVMATTIAAGSTLGAGPTRLLMGLGLSMGLLLVTITGAELFTGNNMVLMGLFSRRISPRELVRNWGLVYVGNLVGSLAVVLLIYWGQWWMQEGTSFGAAALNTANHKVNLSFPAIFMRGILANVLVCLAVWQAMAGRTLVDKLAGIALPVTAFVAAGFEHSVANMYFVPIGVLLAEEPAALEAAGLTDGTASRLTVPWAAHNLAAASLGNIVGGGVLVGLAHWFVHLRDRPPDGQASAGE